MAIILFVYDRRSEEGIPYPWARIAGVTFLGDENGNIDLEGASFGNCGSNTINIGALGYDSESTNKCNYTGGGSRNLEQTTSENIHGHIIDCVTKDGIEGVTVKWKGKTETTNYNGFYKILNPSTGSGTLEYSHSDYDSKTKESTYSGGGWEINGCLDKEEIPEDKSGCKVYKWNEDTSNWSLQHFYKTLAEAETMRDTLEDSDNKVKITRLDNLGNEVETLYETGDEIIEEPTFTNRVFGYVKGPLGTGLQFASVSFGDKSAITNSSGYYEILDIFVSGQIEVSAYGYSSKIEWIDAPMTGDLQQDFRLNKIEIAETIDDAWADYVKLHPNEPILTPPWFKQVLPDWGWDFFYKPLCLNPAESFYKLIFGKNLFNEPEEMDFWSWLDIVFVIIDFVTIGKYSAAKAGLTGAGKKTIKEIVEEGIQKAAYIHPEQFLDDAIKAVTTRKIPKRNIDEMFDIAMKDPLSKEFLVKNSYKKLDGLIETSTSSAVKMVDSLSPKMLDETLNAFVKAGKEAKITSFISDLSYTFPSVAAKLVKQLSLVKAGLIAGGGLTIWAVASSVTQGYVTVMGAVTFALFILEEACQSASFAVSNLIRAEQFEEARVSNARLDLLATQGVDYCDNVLVQCATPITVDSFKKFFESIHMNVETFTTLIDANKSTFELTPGETYKVYIAEVIDGDTFKCYYQTKTANKIVVRWAGINTPEKKFTEGRLCRDYVKNLIEGKTANIVVKTKDPYGRYVCAVIIDKININEKLVKEGMTYAYPEGAEFAEPGFEALEKTAREKGKGIFAILNEYNIMAGELTITSKPTYCRIIIDDVDTGKITAESLRISLGSHEIRCEKEGYETGIQTVIIEEGDDKEIRFELNKADGEPTSDNFGTLKITSKPSYAFIDLDGQRQNFLTPENIKLEPGTYEVIISKPGLNHQAFNITISAGKIYEKRIELTTA